MTLHPDILQRIGWTLIHFAWQAAVVAAVLKTALWACRHRSPQVRYLLSCAALLAMTGLPILTYTLNWGSDGGRVTGPNFTNSERKTRAFSPVEREPSLLSRTIVKATALVYPALEPIARTWMIGLAVLMARYVVQWLTLRRRLRVQNIGSPALLEQLAELRQQMSVRTTMFAMSGKIESPVTFRFIRPIVLLPATAVTGMPSDLLMALVAHELAHIRRHDYLVNLLQMVMEHLLFFHPAVWWVSAQIRKERENCCDDIASQTAGHLVYARALERMEGLRHEEQAMVLAATDGSLVSRVKRLLIGKPRVSPGGAILSAGITLTLLLSASTIFGHTMQPNELWWRVQQNRHTTAAVYDAVGLESDSTAFLEPLAQAVRNEKPTDEEMDNLVEAFKAGAKYDALAQILLPTMSVTDDWAHEKTPTWRYGVFFRRFSLSERLWIKALKLEPSDPSRARDYARAALLLSGQELQRAPFFVGRLDNDPRFSEVAQITERQRERLRLVLGPDLAVSQKYSSLLSPVRETVRRAILYPDLPAKMTLDDCRRNVMTAVPFCVRERYNVQRDIAQVVWMLRRIDEPLALSLAEELKAYDYGDHWQRWLNEAATTTVQFQPVIPKPVTRPAKTDQK